MIANDSLKLMDLRDAVARCSAVAVPKVIRWNERFPAGHPAPVFTVDGQYTARGWTEWTQGFQVGALLLLAELTGDEQLWRLGLEGTSRLMPRHITSFGVHDHGFNIVSTFGNLARLAQGGRFTAQSGTIAGWHLALIASGAIQARRWTPTADGGGFIYSFNGPHSLFADTMRSLRSLALAWRLGGTLLGEQDAESNLLIRLWDHARTTARYTVYYGEGRDAYDISGRVAHESLFNPTNGVYRAPATQQGFSPFSTWTRGLAWVLLGFAEQLEFLATLSEEDWPIAGKRGEVIGEMERAADAVADFFLRETSPCGVCYWDTGAPGLVHLGNYRETPADPFNRWEPVDSSASAIAAQGLIRLSRCLSAPKSHRARYFQAGLRIAATLLVEPYLATDPAHEGLLLHSIYHRPNGWDHVRPGQSIPNGESCLWGDYHLLELALYLDRLATGSDYRFFDAIRPIEHMTA